MDERMLQMLPHVRFPGTVFTGPNSLYYLKMLDPAVTLMLVSETAWRLHREKMEKHLQATNVKTLSSEPSKSDMNDLHDDIKQHGYETVVGFGGGSVMDLAKTAKLHDKKIRLILVPTTSGTGSEASRYSILVNDEKQKEALASDDLVPDIVLLNHAFSMTLPKRETAYTSIDALSHSIEGLVSKMSNPLSDLMALSSIDTIARNVGLACENPEDAAARASLQTAGFLGGLVQSSASVGLAHSFANYLGPKMGMPHGVAIGTFLIDTIRLNMEKADKYEKLKDSVFFGNGDVLGKLTELFNGLGFDAHRKRVDLGSIDPDEAAEMIKSDVCTKTNPYSPSVDEIKGILSAAGGRR
jgi:alcohol dehydrogenase class IV